MDPINPFAKPQPPISQPAVIKSSSSFEGFLKSKFIFVILGVVILMEGFVLFNSFKTSPSSPTNIASNDSQNQALPLSVGSLGGAKLGVVTDKKDFKVGEKVPVTVRVFSGGYFTDGVDLVLKYNPKILEASTSAIQSGNLFQNYPIKNIDQTTGTVNISGISSATGVSFNGMGNFLTINFNAKAKGSSDLVIQYTLGSTHETNVVKQKEAIDILDGVTNATINVSDEGGAATASCGKRTLQSCVDSEGRSGSFWCSVLTDSTSCQIGCFKEETGTELGCKVISN